MRNHSKEFAIRINAAHDSAVRAAIDRELASPQPNAAFAPWLAHRDRYPEAIRHLERICTLYRGQSDFTVARSLSERHSRHLWPRRVALALHVIGCEALSFGLEDLRKRRSEAGRCGLAVCGEIDWPKANRRVRAGFILGALIRERLP